MLVRGETSKEEAKYDVARNTTDATADSKRDIELWIDVYKYYAPSSRWGEKLVVGDYTTCINVLPFATSPKWIGL